MTIHKWSQHYGRFEHPGLQSVVLTSFSENGVSGVLFYQDNRPLNNIYQGNEVFL